MPNQPQNAKVPHGAALQVKKPPPPNMPISNIAPKKDILLFFICQAS